MSGSIVMILAAGADSGEGWQGATQVALILGIVILTGVMLRATLRRLRSGQSPPDRTARETFTQLSKQQSGVRDDVERVMVELEQLARQIRGEIDTRFAKLQAVIRDADERIDRLSRMTSVAPDVAVTDDVTKLDVTVGDGDAPPPQATVEGGGDMSAAIYRLADEGLAPGEIAGRLNHLVGEVELVLALRTTKAQAARLPA